MTMKVFIAPHFDGVDQGDGGIRRVVEAQRAWLPKLGVDIVEHPDNADVLALHAAAWVDSYKPTVSHCHGLYWDEYEWPQWCHTANKSVLDAIRRADVVTAPSKWVAEAITRNAWIKAIPLYHGINPAEWVDLPQASSNGGYVLWNKTRVDPICDPTPLDALAKRAPSIQFMTTFGTSAPNVKVTGRLPYEQGKPLISQAAVYLATSRETFGIGTLEAMACGVPVLGWRWGGQAEFIQNRVNGYLATPGDFDDLLTGLHYCLENRRQLGEAARQLVLDQFTWEHVMKDYVNVYEEAVETINSHRLPKISVVITNYNLGKYLSDAVGSVIAQEDIKPEAVEIVIVDDASTDPENGAVLVEVHNKAVAAKHPVQVIRNTTNQYLAGALNIGIEAARGDFIVPLDADNMLGPRALSVLGSELAKSRDLDIAYGAMSTIHPTTHEERTSTWPQQFDFHRQMTHANQIPSTSMYRKKIWARVGGYRRRCRTAEDADFWCRATSFGARARKVTDAVVLRYLDRHDSMSHVNQDWPWHKWYPWYKSSKFAPPVAPVDKLHVHTYEPPLISVIIPVGPGHERIVLDAIDSLVAQDFQKWECVVVNDTGSPLPWVHPFARVVTLGSGNGDRRMGASPARARNAGIAVARGRTFIPLDADDYLQPEALSTMFRVWLATGKESYVYSDWVVQETGQVKEAPEYDCRELVAHLPHAVTALYPKAAWQAVGGFDEHLQAWEDWDFVIALAAKGYCGVRAPLALMQYRMSAGQRREALYARQDELKVEIRSKWARYIDGGEQLMACGRCGGSRAPVESLLGAAAVAGGAPAEGMTLLRYSGKISGPITFIGRATGTQYRFGLQPGHETRYVFDSDVQGLMDASRFAKVEATSELLQAAGR